MKKQMKFIVMVFGVTLAIFGSIDARALTLAPDTIRCSGDSGGCAKTATGHWLVGTRSQTN